MKLVTHTLTYQSLILTTLLVTGAGCGSSGPERAIVHGTVRYDGQEVGDGEILFVPKKGTKGNGGGSRIVRGKYRVDIKGGLQLGEYTVKIDAFELAPGAEPPPAVISIETPRGKPYLPEKYNLRTTLEMNLSNSIEQQKDFDLAQ